MVERSAESIPHSLSEEPPVPMAERRDGERHLTLFRVGAMVVGNTRELCLIKNISSGGMMLRVYSPLAVGERLEVELKNGQPISGTVSWVRGDQAGIAFSDKVDVLAILAGEEQGARPRMPRIETSASVTVREGASTWRMTCCDISQGGVKLLSSAPLAAGADVVVTLTGMAPQPGVVRWNSGGQTGIAFNRPLPLSDLVAWLKAQRDSSQAA